MIKPIHRVQKRRKRRKELDIVVIIKIAQNGQPLNGWNIEKI